MVFSNFFMAFLLHCPQHFLQIAACGFLSADHRQTNVLQRTGIAGSRPLSLGRMPFPAKLVHLFGSICHSFPQFRRKLHPGTMPCFPIIQKSDRYVAAQHLFQAHCLCCELCNIAFVFLGFATFVLHRCYCISTLLSENGNAFRRAPEFYRIALSAQPQTADDTFIPLTISRSPRFSRNELSCTLRCMILPSAVRSFSTHCCSRYASAHCRRQNTKCWMPESCRYSSSRYSIAAYTKSITSGVKPSSVSSVMS